MRGMTRSLLISALLAACLCLAQAVGSVWATAAVLSACLVWMLQRAAVGQALACLLFFLPWSTLMKLHPGGNSFYTFGLLGAAVIAFGRNDSRLETTSTVLTGLLFMLVCSARLLRGAPPEANMLAFFALLLLLPALARMAEAEDFQSVTLLFVFGILSAALAARVLEAREALSGYIRLHSYAGIVRRSGLYGDPNFYAAQVAAALGGALLSAEKRKRWIPVCLALFLVGLASFSKMFLLVIALEVLVGILWARGGCKIGYLALLLFAVALSAAFPSQLRAMLARFGVTGGMAVLTTGRTELWSSYARAFVLEPRLLLFGEGFARERLLMELGSHSTPLQLIFQLGLPGAALMSFWLGSLFVPAKGRRIARSGAVVLLIGAFLPWLALDMLFFDEFLLLPIYAALALHGEEPADICRKFV